MRYLMPLLFLLAALVCYGAGFESGAWLAIALGVLFELGFWLGLHRLIVGKGHR